MEHTVLSFQFSGEILSTETEYEVRFPDGRCERFPKTMRLSDLAEAIGAKRFNYHADLKIPSLPGSGGGLSPAPTEEIYDD